MNYHEVKAEFLAYEERRYNNYYLLISVDFEETDFDRIIMKEINPFLESQKHKLNSKDEVSKT